MTSSTESEVEPYRIAQGHYDAELTALGCRQAAALGKRFAEIPLDALYVSDRYRACATADALSRISGLPISRRENLQEVFLGPWEGQCGRNLAYEERCEINCFKTAPARWSLDGAEKPAQAAARLLKALRAIAEENRGKTVEVDSHMLVIQLA